MRKTAVGIISEYNPFHNGHRFQLEEAKKKTGADVVIAFMSGNWTQRGEPAIFDKWARTRQALNNGVDIVVELPFLAAVQPADLFASRAVELAAGLFCSYLSFGVEHDDWDFSALSAASIPRDGDFKNHTVPFPTAFHDAIKKVTGVDLREPNDTLAYWYAHKNNQLGKPMHLVPVKRKLVGHQKLETHGSFASASAIRDLIWKGHGYSQFLSGNRDFLTKERPLFWKDFWPYLQYETLEAGVSNLSRIYQMNEGLEYRLTQAIAESDSFLSFLENVKTKRYTYPRLLRLFSYVLFQISAGENNDYRSCARLLGMNANGRMYLNQIRDEIKIPIISRPSKKDFETVLKTEKKVGQLVECLNGKKEDLYTHPIIL